MSINSILNFQRSKHGSRRRQFVAVLLAIAVLFTAIGGTAVTIAQTIPTISIASVAPDTSVTIRTNNYPANQTFTVTMGKMGTKGVSGIVVGTFNSGAGGTMTASFPIPAELQGAPTIAIRAQTVHAIDPYYSYNWFYNNTGGTVSTPPPTSPVPTPSVPDTGGAYIPTFTIVSVVRNQSVTIRTSNFPANRSFTVTMGAFGTKGVDGTVVGTTQSGEGGTFTATYNIPASQQGAQRIAIRLQSPSGYYSYNWFFNNTTP